MMLVICAALCVAAGVTAWAVDRWTRRSPVPYVVLSIASFVVAATAILVASSTRPNEGTDLTLTGSSPLVALGSADRTGGAYFFLGTGVVEEKRVYVYLKETPMGIIQDYQRVDISYVVEGEGQPRMEEWSDCDMSGLVPWPTCSLPIYKFHVPAGSVVRDFEVVL